MRLRAVVAGLLLLALSAVVFTTGAGRGAAPALPLPSPRRTVSTAPQRPPAIPERNVFEYGGQPAPVPAPLSPPRAAPSPFRHEPEAPPTPPEPSVRLVGFLRRAGALKAALAVRGSVYVVGVGERVEGYSLLSADEDTGVRIEGPDGAVLALPPS